MSLFVCIAVPPVPEIDLGFALSSTSALRNETFKLMKKTISYIIDTYGTKKIHYTALVYGDVVATEIGFEDKLLSAEELKTAIAELPVSTGTPNLAGALEEAVKVFENVNRRPLTRKVRL